MKHIKENYWFKKRLVIDVINRNENGWMNATINYEAIAAFKNLEIFMH